MLAARRFSPHIRRCEKPGVLVRRSTTSWCIATSLRTALNQVWLTDITEHHTDEGKLYLCAINDACSNRVVGCSIDPTMKTRIAINAGSSTVAGRGVTSCGGRLRCPLRQGQLVQAETVRRRAQAPRLDRSMARSAQPGTPPRWIRSSLCCRRASRTGNAGAPAKSSGWRS